MQSNDKFRKNNIKLKNYLIVLSTLLMAFCAAGSTLAYLTRQNIVMNRFAAGRVQVQVVETGTDNVKRNSSVRNTGNVPVYIRAAIVLSWQDVDGNALWSEGPEQGRDYQISITSAPGLNGGEWIRASDGLYYYNLPVEPGGKSTILVRELRELSVSSHREEGKYLTADIQVQAVQAEPAEAALDAWGGDNGSVKSVEERKLVVKKGGGAEP